MKKKMKEDLSIQHIIDLNMVQALGTNTLIHTDIDELYDSNAALYERFYRTSPLFDYGLFDMHPVHFKSYLKKATGIYYYTKSHPIENGKLNRLIKKGYSEVYRYVLENKLVQPLKLMQLLNKKRSRGINNHDRPLQYAYAIMFHLASNARCPIENGDYVVQMLVELTKQQYFDYNIQGQIDVDYSDISKVLREDFFRGFKEMNILHLINALMEDEVVRTLGNNKNPSLEQYELTKDKLYDEGFETAVIGFYTGILKSNGFFDQKLNRILTEEESITYLRMMDMFLENMTHLSSEVLETLKISSLFMLGIIKEHEDLEVLYDDQVNNTKANVYLKEIERIKVEMEQQRINQAANFFKKENELANVNKLVIQSRQENENLKKEMQRLQQQLNEAKQNNLEVQALREYVFTEENIVEHAEVIDDTFNKANQYLKDKKIVIAGGHTNWVRKMKQAFPDFIYLSNDDEKRSVDFLKQDDYYVFINTATNSHALYQRIISQLNSRKQLGYINRNYNINTSVQIMVDFIESNEK